MGVDGAWIDEACLAEPATDFFKGECVSAIGVDQHVNAEDEAANRSGSIGVHEEFRDGDGCAWGERVEGPG